MIVWDGTPEECEEDGIGEEHQTARRQVLRMARDAWVTGRLDGKAEQSQTSVLATYCP